MSEDEVVGWRIMKGQSLRASREPEALSVLSSSDEGDPATSIVSLAPLNDLGGALTFPFCRQNPRGSASLREAPALLQLVSTGGRSQESSATTPSADALL